MGKRDIVVFENGLLGSIKRKSGQIKRSVAKYRSYSKLVLLSIEYDRNETVIYLDVNLYRFAEICWFSKYMLKYIYA